MPSDQVLARVLEELSGPQQAFRSTVAGMTEELRGLLAQAEDGGVDQAERWAAELGPYASSRIDLRRLARLFPEAPGLGPASRSLVERSLEVLSEFAAGSDSSPLQLHLPEGGDLRDLVRDAYARIGRIFAAARAAAAARNGHHLTEERERRLATHPFRDWSPRERAAAPPLIVEVSGADLQAGGLADFLYGGVRLVLVVSGEAPPAPLARLVSPGTLVIQSRDPGAVRTLVRGPVPAIAAVFTDPEAEVVSFTHDPRAGAFSWSRIEVEDPSTLEPPEEGRRRPSGWAEDLAHLRALVARPEEAGGGAPSAAAAEGTSEAGAPGESAGDRPGSERAPGAAVAAPSRNGAHGEEDPAGRLAAWLLARTELNGV